MITTPPVPAPSPNESEDEFIVRAHQATLATIPDPMSRNRAVWSAWDSYRGNPERDRAEAFFPPEQFEHKRDVCLWHEHEAVARGEDGTPVVKNNNVDRLRAIIRENNHRIADTDAYTAIVDKHTLAPGSDDAGKDKPKTLGFAGPYRLGMVGRIQPRFAIFGDEHHRRDRSEVLKDRPRRSVEVLTLRANGRSYIDPIAALSEAPRLPLPVQYSAEAEGDLHVDRYQAESVAAFPGGGNTYLPGAGGRRREKETFGVDNDDDDQPASEQNTMLGPEDLRQIVDAIMSTEPMQWALSQMQQQGVDPTPQAGGTPEDPNAPPTQEPYQGPAAPPAPAMPPAPPIPQPPMQPQPYGAQRYSAESDPDLENEEPDVNAEQYAEQYQAMVESNEQLIDSNRQLMERMNTLTQQNAALAAKSADAERKERINELYHAYPHMIDVEAEHEKCLYSFGSTMNDDDFEAYTETVETLCQKAPVANTMVPDGVMPRNSQPEKTVESQQYEARVQEKSTEIYSAALARGEFLTPDQAWAQAEKEIG